MTELKRALGLPLLLGYGLGNILGAGIYVLIGKVAGTAGLYMPVAFLVASIVAGFSACSYAELAARYPSAAGEAVYVQEGFHMIFLSRATGILIALAGMVSAATIAHGFAGYFRTFVELPEPLIVTGIILLLGLLAIRGIAQSVTVAAVLTLIEAAGLLLVIYAGHTLLGTLPAQSDLLLPPPAAAAWSGILVGAFLAFFAFIGFEDMVNVAEEVTRPRTIMPLAILLTLLTATVLYVLVALVAVLALPADRLARSTAPLADVLAAISDIDPGIISAIGLLAVVNGALIQIIMAARIFYGMARRNWLPPALGHVGSRTRTPVRATWLVIAVILALALLFPLETLARGTSTLVLAVFALVNAALLLIKRREPAPQGILTVPRWLPVAGLLSCTGLILFQLMPAR